jgi:hypothetical protein
MALPRPKSIFDAALRLAPATKAAEPTGMPFADAPTTVYEEAGLVMDLDDASFDGWLKEQKPDLGAPNHAFATKLFNDKMMQIWMRMTTAATKAQVAYTHELWKRSPAHRPEESDYGPTFRSTVWTEEDEYREHGIPEQALRALQEAFDAEQARIEAMRQTLLTLVARAERLQGKINFVV